MKLMLPLCILITSVFSASAQNLNLKVDMPDLPEGATAHLIDRTTNRTDTVQVKNHSFSFHIPLKKSSSFILQVGEGEGSLSGLGTIIYLEPGNMSISGKGGGFRRATYSGDEFARKWQTFLPVMNELEKKSRMLETLENELGDAGRLRDEQNVQMITDLIKNVKQETLQIARNWLNQHLNSGITAFMLQNYTNNVMSEEEMKYHLSLLSENKESKVIKASK